MIDRYYVMNDRKSEFGDYVLYSDYAALEKLLDKRDEDIDLMEKNVRAIKKENAKLREALEEAIEAWRSEFEFNSWVDLADKWEQALSDKNAE